MNNLSKNTGLVNEKLYWKGAMMKTHLTHGKTPGRGIFANTLLPYTVHFLEEHVIKHHYITVSYLCSFSYHLSPDASQIYDLMLSN